MNLALLTLLGLLAGCASNSSDVVSRRHLLDGKKVDMIPDNLLETSGPMTEGVWLNAARIFQDDWVHQYYLEAKFAAYRETGLLDIRPGTSLIVVADGKELRFESPTGSLNLRDTSGELLTERALYDATPADLITIGQAKNVTVKLIGARTTLERPFGPKNLERFRKFSEQFILHKR